MAKWHSAQIISKLLLKFKKNVCNNFVNNNKVVHYSRMLLTWNILYQKYTILREAYFSEYSMSFLYLQMGNFHKIRVFFF